MSDELHEAADAHEAQAVLLMSEAEAQRGRRQSNTLRMAQVHATLAASRRYQAIEVGPSWRTINVNGDSIPRWAEDLIAAVGAGRWDFRAAPEPTDIPPAPVPPGEQGL